MAFRTRFQLNLNPYIFNNQGEFFHLLKERNIDLEQLLELGKSEQIILDSNVNMIDGDKIECTLLWDDEYSFLQILATDQFKHFKAMVDNSGWELILQERGNV